MAKKAKHTHQYVRTYPFGKVPGPLGKVRGVWSCALPDCTHFMPSNMEPPLGKLSICNQCMETFLLDEENMKMDKPICMGCLHPEDVVEMPKDFDFERLEARTYIANKEGKSLEDVTEAEVDRMVQLRRTIKGL